MPLDASSALRLSIIISFILSIPNASDSTTSTSLNLSITRPGNPSASPKMSLHEEVSTVSTLYCTASRTSLSIKSLLISTSRCLVIIRTVIFDLVFMKPFPRKYPSKSSTSTISPFSNSPFILSISLSYIQSPPALKLLPSPFFIITSAIFSTCINQIISIISAREGTISV